jgi:DNA transformation protein and related proteins
MAYDSGLVTHLLELLEPMRGVRGKKMFGGYGIFRDDLMFGLVAEDTLYFKVDATTIDAYIERGLEPFVYIAPGDKKMTMSYYQVPEEALDNSEEMMLWAEQAFQVALRAQAAKPKKKAKT